MAEIVTAKVSEGACQSRVTEGRRWNAMAGRIEGFGPLTLGHGHANMLGYRLCWHVSLSAFPSVCCLP